MQTAVRVYNTNTDRIIVETVEVDENGEYEEDGTYTIPGVGTPGSEVKCAFVDPVGSMTGKLFPTGRQQEMLRVTRSSSISTAPDLIDVRVTLIDGANPFVLIDSTSISTVLKTLPSEIAQHELVECIRQQGAVAMGLAPSLEAASQTRGTPKIALIYPPLLSPDPKTPTPDLRVQAYSMGLPHPSLQLTGAVCIATALCAPGTVAAELSHRAVIDDGAPGTPEESSSDEEGEGGYRHVVIAHSKGTIGVDIVLRSDGQVGSCSVSRTARRLFEGRVRYYIEDQL